MTEKVHTGMRIEASQLEKLKYISWHDRRTFTSVMDIAVSEYLGKWEKANGAITEKMLKEAKIK